MAMVYGIDLGTTYSVIATLDGYGLPSVIENYVDDSRKLASAVFFQENGTPVVGETAKSQIETAPERVVQFAKRYIGKSDAPTWEIDGKEYNPIVISSFILNRMKEYAEEQSGEPVENVVITCPAYFGNEERNATRQAGKIAGLNVLDIINEPTAAAINYCSREYGENRKILVYDLGGGTFDVTLLDFKMDGDESDASAVLDIIDSNGDDRLGGIDWDERLYSYMIDLYCEENGISADEVSDDVKLSIRRQVEGTKMLLSRKATHGINVYDEGEACHIEVSAEGFKERTSDLVERTMFFVQQLLDDNSVTPDDIDVVLLVGGSTKMPAVKDAVEAMFPGKVRVEDPDLAVAKGAAIAAAIKVIETRSDNDGTTGGKDNHTNPSPAPKGISEEQIQQLAAIIPQKTKVYDKLSRSFGPAIMVEDVLMIENLIYAGDKIPASADATYGTRVDNQREVVIGIYENVGKDRVENRYVTPTYNEHDEEQYTDPNLKVKKIGELRLDLLPDMPAGSPIEVSFTCSAAGLDVLARDPKSGKEVNAHIDSENTLSEEEIAEATDKVAAMGTTGSF